MKSMKIKTYTKKPKRAVTGLIIPEDKNYLAEAAAYLGISQSQFFRDALREKVQRTFRARRQKLDVNRPELTATV
jgi:hypothetical protein